MKIFHAELINTHGGSIRVYITTNPDKSINNTVSKLLEEEEKFGLKNIDTYIEFG